MSVAPTITAEAKAAGLIYVDSCESGYWRHRCGRGFRYQDAGGNVVRSHRLRRRFESLVIPPAWERVWICDSPKGHLQATGYDARGRKQYRYHAEWRRIREETKFERMTQFAGCLPAVRRRINSLLKQPGLSREKILATALCILDRGRIRVGNAEYVQANGSYGLTTLRRKHVEIRGDQITFCFRGKSGLRHCVTLEDRRLSRIIRRCSELPGQRLFQYVDSQGENHPIDSTTINSLIREWTRADFTAKDFRTWSGTVAFIASVMSAEGETTSLKDHLQRVADSLGNTPAICRKHYIHPVLLEDWKAGQLLPRIEQLPRKATPRGLTAAERVTFQLLLEPTRG